METTLSVINLFPSTKEQIKSFVNATVNEVKCGNINALELKSKLKFIEKVAEEIDKQTKEDQLKERQKYQEKIVELYGAKIEVAELGTKYDFSNCGDKDWEYLDIQLRELSELKKEREAFLKTIKKPMSIVHHETGECYDIVPPIKSSTTGLKFTL